MERIEVSNIEELPMGKLQKVADLIHHDGPLLSLFKDLQNEDYLYYWFDSDAQTNHWLIFPVARQNLQAYFDGRISLRDLILAADPANTFLVALDDDLKLHKAFAISPSEINPEELPDEDSLYEFTPIYVDEFASPADENDLIPIDSKAIGFRETVNLIQALNEQEKRETYKIYLDGFWNLNDLIEFPNLYSKAYAFLYSLKGDQELFRQQYNSQPWKGGFSTVNFYQGLQYRIPSRHTPQIVSIQYASPGWIELSLIEANALEIKNLVLAFLERNNSLKRIYTDIYKELKERQLLGRKLDERKQHSGQDSEFLKQASQEFAALLGVDNSLTKINKLTENPLITLKMLLSFYRIIRELSEFQLQGKIKF